jgi:cytochrome c556
MKRASVLAIAASAALALVAATAVIAQQNPIEQRQALMKKNNQHAKETTQMVKGEQPFNAQAVAAAFAQWADTADKFAGLFPENSKTGGDTRAAPEIWLDKPDFNAQVAAFAKVVADNRAKAVASLDGLKAALPAVGKVCGDCHEKYRTSR